MNEAKSFIINNNEYVPDPCLEQYELASAIIADSGIEVDFEKDDEAVIQQKVSKFVGYLIKQKKSAEFLAYCLKPKDDEWNKEKQEEYEKDFKTEKTFNFTVIVGSFFLQTMQIYSGYFGGLKQSTEESSPQKDELKA